MDELDPDLSARVQPRRYQKRQQSTDTVSKLDSISTTVQKLNISGRSAPVRDAVMVTDGNLTKGKQDKQRPTKRMQQRSRYSPIKPAGHSAPTPRPISEQASHSYGNSTVWTEPYEQLRCLFRFIEHCCCSDHFLKTTTSPSRQK
ncbi:hypothetical protein FGIG_03487 [Fasciola gigantica]|uniref:Uncharacterized protein n=1 Tax=Fasciola gigantica TaxID=46835 RepID=A0A504Z5I6_FASGI|nr:hypothetical protein FGIG_03487 [Fasciola gigantica]